VGWVAGARAGAGASFAVAGWPSTRPSAVDNDPMMLTARGATLRSSSAMQY
jgi:hypothetical protein